MSSPMQKTRSSASISSYIASVIASISVFGFTASAVVAMDSSSLAVRAASLLAALESCLVSRDGGLVLRLVFGPHQERRHGNGTAGLVDRDEGHVGGAGVTATAAAQVLALDVDADFERRLRGVGHARLQVRDVAHRDRRVERQVVHRRGDA